MQGADKGQAAELHGRDLHVGIVQARFNDALTGRMAQVCIDELITLGVSPKHIKHVTVPGALEVPVALQAMADSDRFDALVALGCIIRGETYHFEIVSNESARGLMDLTLQGYAIGNGIMTVENEAQAIVRCDPAQLDKGGAAARAALALFDLREKYAP